MAVCSGVPPVYAVPKWLDLWLTGAFWAVNPGRRGENLPPALPPSGQQARRAADLTIRVPALREAQSRGRSAGLPAVIHAPMLIPLFTCLMGAWVAFFGAGRLVFAPGMDQPERGLERAPSLGVWKRDSAGGSFFVLHFWFGFIWRCTFDQDAIRLDFIFSSKAYDPTAIQAMQVVEEVTSVRGLTRRRYKLRLEFGADSYLGIEPKGFSFPMDYSAERKKYFANELLARLDNHYNNFNATRVITSA